MKQFPTLFSRASTGAIQQWTITVDCDSFYTEAGQVGGALTRTLPTVAKGKNIGKKNETTPAQQAEIEATAKWDKKKKSNYFENVADIDKGFLEPQLAKPGAKYMDKIVWADGQIVDDKLNGFACIITAKGAFTRTNEQYHAIPHIVEELKGFFNENPDAYLQGELFNPDYVNNLGALSELISVVRQPKDITPELLSESKKIVQFHLYDFYNACGVSINTRLKERRIALDAAIVKHRFLYIKPVRYTVCYSFAETKRVADDYIARGGEGVIIKNPNAEYQHKRTKDLLKFKKQEDEEFQIVDDMDNPFEEGSGNSAGCAESVWCHVKGTRADRFKANCEGSKERLRDIFKRPQDFKGKYITVRYQEKSPYGIPLIPYTNLVIRDEVEGFKSGR